MLTLFFPKKVPKTTLKKDKMFRQFPVSQFQCIFWMVTVESTLNSAHFHLNYFVVLTGTLLHTHLLFRSLCPTSLLH